jgi:hypothetical protein
MPAFNIFGGLQCLVQPTTTPVSVQDAKAHSRVFTTADDSLIAGYINVATIACQDRCRRAFMPQVWQLGLQQFPGRTPWNEARPLNPQDIERNQYIELPMPPLIAVIPDPTATNNPPSGITYYDTNYNQYFMTLTGIPPLPPPTTNVGNFIVQTNCEPGTVRLPFAGVWPTTILIPGVSIYITYQCGYAAYSGMLTMDQNGNCTPAGSPPVLFDPRLAGTWITVTSTSGGSSAPNYTSFTVAQVTSPTSMQVVIQNPLPQPPPYPSQPDGSPASWTGNIVWMPIRQAILYLAAHLYENREPIITGRGEVAIEIPDTIDAMLTPYKIFRT